MLESEVRLARLLRWRPHQVRRRHVVLYGSLSLSICLELRLLIQSSRAKDIEGWLKLIVCRLVQLVELLWVSQRPYLPGVSCSKIVSIPRIG